MATPLVTSTPDITRVIDQRYFLLPLGGPNNPRTYLDRFPEEVYNKGMDSLLIKFMYSALGPAGAGWLRKNHLQARLTLEDYGLETFNLDEFYSNPFGFGRIFDEIYIDDTTGLISSDKWQEIKRKDASYRSRAIDFISGARAGNTPFGIRLVSRSGLGHDVEVIENYKYLYDQISDDPLGLGYFGLTNSTEEFIIIPRREAPVTETQVLSVIGDPTGGTISIFFPATESDASGVVTINYNASATDGWLTKTISGKTTSGSPIITELGATDDLVVGMSMGGPNITPGATIISIDSPSQVTLSSNSTATATSILTLVSSAWTGVKEALESIPQIGPDNVIVEGGRLPSEPIRITFTKDLGFKDVPTLIVESYLSPSNGTGVQISTERNGYDPTDEIVSISPSSKHNLYTALEKVKPVASIATFNQSRGLTSRQIWDRSQASSEYKEVVRFVTGQSGINWPTVDGIHWIVSGEEREAPKSLDGSSQHYVGFHNVADICAYTDEALNDPDYLTDNWPSVKDNYKSEMIGRFSPYQEALYPVLISREQEDHQHHADHAPADYSEPVIVTSTTSDLNNLMPLINGIYPADYASLEGVPAPRYIHEQFWASIERPVGADILEIDLGSVKPINYVSFEITRKPIDIEICFDSLDLYPSRSWVPVTDVPGLLSPSSVGYDFTSINPWASIEYYFTNSLSIIPYTRFIRLKFTRRADPGSPFVTSDNENLPFSIDVKNLRLARSVN